MWVHHDHWQEGFYHRGTAQGVNNEVLLMDSCSQKWHSRGGGEMLSMSDIDWVWFCLIHKSKLQLACLYRRVSLTEHFDCYSKCIDFRIPPIIATC